jgi:hypothetical protein
VEDVHAVCPMAQADHHDHDRQSITSGSDRIVARRPVGPP